MSRQSFLAVAVIASLAGADPSGAVVSLPDETTSKVLAEIGKPSRPPANAADSLGGWFFADGPRAKDHELAEEDSMQWVAEDMASTTVEDRQALVEKWKGKLPVTEDSGNCLVIRHLALGDGTLGAASVFADGFEGVLDSPEGGMLVHDGVLYFACVPKLMMLRDADGDGRAEQRKVIQERFGVRVSTPGHGFGGLTLGPDGRIYGSIGDKGLDFTTPDGTVCRLSNQGAAFRFELDGSGFECFHTGLRNPGRISFDALGNAFTVDENPGTKGSARVIYLVDGGDSGWRMGHEELLSFPERIGGGQTPADDWNDGYLSRTLVAGKPATIVPSAGHLDVRPAGMAHHPGTGFLKSGIGRFFVGDLRENPDESGVWSFEMQAEGAGMKMAGARRELAGIAVSDVEFSPDGRLWLTDSAAGRLLAVDAGAKTWLPIQSASAAKLLKEGFHQRGSAELANLLRHPNSRVSLSAQLALTRKKDALERFVEATLSSNTMVRMHGIRGLGIIVRCGTLPEAFNDFASIPFNKSVAGALEKLVVLTNDKDEEIRCQSLRALADARDDAPNLNLGLLLDDPSPRVRSFAAIVAGKRKMSGLFGPVCEMLANNANQDPWLFNAGAYALQRMAPDSSLLRALVDHESSAVRLAAVTGLRRMESPDVVEYLGDPDPVVVDGVLRAVWDLDLADARPAVAALLDQRKAADFSPGMLRRMMHNSFRIGDALNAARVLKLAMDATLSNPLREEAFGLLELWCKPLASDPLTGRWASLDSPDPVEIVSLLRKSLPSIPPRDAAGIAAAQGLVKVYQLDPSIIPTPMVPVPVEGYAEIPAHPAMANPWLYLMIGMLLVTGILLYVDPRIF